MTRVISSKSLLLVNLVAALVSAEGLGGTPGFDAPGAVYAEDRVPRYRNGGIVKGNVDWTVRDFLGREVMRGKWNATKGSLLLNGLKRGYYTLSGAGVTNALGRPVPFVIVAQPKANAFDETCTCCFATDSALSMCAKPGKFRCPWFKGDSRRFVAEMMRLCGVRQTRERLGWAGVEPEQGKFDFSRRLKTARMLKECGIRSSVVLHSAPDWARAAAKGSVTTKDLSRGWIVANRLGRSFDGLVECWEISNETDVGFGDEPVWNYAAQFKAMSLGFRSSGAKALVANGGLSGSFVRGISVSYADSLFDNDLSWYTDVLNVHYYGWPSSYPASQRQAQDLLERHGIRDRAVWLTECGFTGEGPATDESVMPPNKAHAFEQELLQAEFLPKSLICNQFCGIARDYFFMFGVLNEQNGNKDWGILRRDGSVKPAFAAFAELNHQVGSAVLLGEVKVAKDVRAFLYGHADGTQTLAYWTRSVIDDEQGVDALVYDGVLERSFTLDAAGARRQLKATRFPSYLPGLRGLRADVEARKPGCVGRRKPTEREDVSVVIRVDADKRDFALADRKTVAELQAESGIGRLSVEIWNFDESVKTGSIACTDYELEGLPDVINLPPMGCATLSLRARARGGVDAEDVKPLRLTGEFNGKRISAFSMNVRPTYRYMSQCRRATLAAAMDPKNWSYRVCSAEKRSLVYDPDEQALHVRAQFAPELGYKQRWFYPELKLQSLGVSLEGAKMIEFEVRGEQDKPENDYRWTCLYFVTAGFPEGENVHKFPQAHYEAPGKGWEKRRVSLVGERLPADLDKNVVGIRFGGNPLGSRVDYLIRNIVVYYED